MADGLLSRKTGIRNRWRRGALIPIAMVVAPPSVAMAQISEITVEGEMFRRTANGRRLAELARGTQVVVKRVDGSWVEVDIEGWIPAGSVGRTSREGHNGIVVADGGERFRSEPSGTVLGLMLEGFLLHRLEDRGGWVRVRRSGWVPGGSLAEIEAPPARPPEGGGVERRSSSGRGVTTGSAEITLRAAPDGRTTVTVESGTPVTVMERDAGWTRVRVEGWVRSEELATAPADSAIAVSAATLRANPVAYAGVRVQWAVQFLALERADPERIDFYEGEPFILARAPDPGEGMVYVAVPAELLPAVEEIRPLQVINIVARVRTGRSALMGLPVLDLVELY